MSRGVRAELRNWGASVDHVREVVGLARPASLVSVLDAFAQPVVLETPITTSSGTPLGGHHRITLRRDGTYRYDGKMRATGFPSYTYLVKGTAVPADGPPATAIAQGAVHGTNEPGANSSTWDQQGFSEQVADAWLAFRTAGLRTELTYDSDWVGVLDDWAVGLIGAVRVFGPWGYAIALGAQLVDALDVPDIAVPGLVGVVVAGGVVLVAGQGAIVPATLLGVAAGGITEAAVKHRQANQAEKDLADRVYQGTIPWDRVVLTNLAGLSGRPFTMPSVGGAILVHLGDGFDNDPANYTGGGSGATGNRAPGELWIHELCHVWQIAHGRFLPGWVCTGVATQAQGGSAYRYGAAGPAWSDFNIEQQAAIVDQWFAGSANQERDASGALRSQQVAFSPEQADDGNPYFRYVRDNVRRAVS